MKKIILACFLLTVFFISFLPVKDTDFGWHYRCGNEFLTQGKLCTSNTFSYFLADYEAYYPSFIYDIVLAYTYNTFGFNGVAILGGLVMTLAAYIFTRSVKVPLWLSGLGFLTTYFLSLSILNIGFRPQILTFSFVITALFFIEKIRQGHLKYFYFFPPFLLFWVNNHIGFFTGLIILGFFGLEQLWQRKNIKLVIVTGFSSFLATLVNPLGYKVYLEIMNHSTSKLNTMIAEWVPPNMFHLVLISLCFITLLYVLVTEKPISIYKILLTLFFTYLAFTARRNLPLFYIVFFYITLSAYQVKNIITKLSHLKYLEDVLLPFSIVLPLIAAFIQIPLTTSFNTDWNKYCYEGLTDVPCKTLQKYPEITGNIYATYEVGGFLIWQKPDSKVFSDGRMPAWHDEHGESPYTAYLKIILALPGWNEKLKGLKTDYIMIPPGTFLGLELQKNADKYGWMKMYQDEDNVIYKNNSVN